MVPSELEFVAEKYQLSVFDNKTVSIPVQPLNAYFKIVKSFKSCGIEIVIDEIVVIFAKGE